MLVLSRKRNQRIRIDGDITIVVVGIFGDTVRLGIEAPDTTAVHREEVHQELCRRGMDSEVTGRNRPCKGGGRAQE